MLLDFEKPIAELEAKLEDMKKLAIDRGVSYDVVFKIVKGVTMSVSMKNLEALLPSHNYRAKRVKVDFFNSSGVEPVYPFSYNIGLIYI